jgi:hypothetical protein
LSAAAASALKPLVIPPGRDPRVSEVQVGYDSAMCTLVLSVEGEGRFWLAANRDESLVRPATPPRRWPDEDFVAPRDEVGGGTWLGLNTHGLFVGVTNRFGAPKDETRHSRGQLVVEALRSKSAAALHASLAGLGADRFNAFHLAYSDGVDCFVTWSDGQVLKQEAFGPGLHVFTERSFKAVPLLPGAQASGEPERVRFIRAQLKELGPRPSAQQLQTLLGTHRPDAPLDSPCVHLPDFGYGTRSSLVLFKAREVAQSDWRWAEGPPDRTPFIAQKFGALIQAR